MSEMLDRAFKQASRLPEPEQDELAAFILAEIADDRRWSEAFAASSSRLSDLASEALREHNAKKTKPLDLGTE